MLVKRKIETEQFARPKWVLILHCYRYAVKWLFSNEARLHLVKLIDKQRPREGDSLGHGGQSRRLRCALWQETLSWDSKMNERLAHGLRVAFPDMQWSEPRNVPYIWGLVI
jgi:hypothetical protein